MWYKEREENDKYCIVEDDKNSSKLLGKYLDKFSKDHDCKFTTSTFFTAGDYIENCRSGFDIVFMDIELPDGNGMESVRRIRELGVESLVIFVTNLAKYAVQGYEVKAFDFIVKPVNYYNFELKLLSALECLDKNGDKGNNTWVYNLRQLALRDIATDVESTYAETTENA